VLLLYAGPTVSRVPDTLRIALEGGPLIITGANLDGLPCTITSVVGAGEDDSDPVPVAIERAT
jgi:hypothetical protein